MRKYIRSSRKGSMRMSGRPAWENEAENQEVRICSKTIGELENQQGRMISSKILKESYMAISAVKQSAKVSLSPRKSQNIFGMKLQWELSEAKLPANILAKEATNDHFQDITTIILALSYQNMSTSKMGCRSYMLDKKIIPSWKCLVVGKSKITKIFEVFNILRDLMREEWILDARIENRNLNKGQHKLCVWVLTARKLKSYVNEYSIDERDILQFETLNIDQVENKKMKEIKAKSREEFDQKNE